MYFRKKTMYKLALSLLFSVIFYNSSFAQNVGIGTSSPSEKLDVNGNINLGGNLRVGGVAGQAGQVLVTNNNGSTGWGNISNPNPCQYKNFVGLKFDGPWTIPQGTKKILVQAWGGGGGGSSYGGGGGGGYITAEFGVNSSSTVNITLGTGGPGTSVSNGPFGNPTNVVVKDSFNTTYTLYAGGGTTSYASGNYTFSASGGSFTCNPGYDNYTGANGRPGEPNSYNYVEKTAGVFVEIVQGGNGGNAGNRNETGGKGGSVVTGGRIAAPGEAQFGGGGGSSASTSATGGNGAKGYVIIWY